MKQNTDLLHKGVGIFLLAWGVFLSIQIPRMFYGLSWRDEGYLLYNAELITQGKIPYRDFFLTTTPGNYYIQAFVLQAFGGYVFTDRLLYVGFVSCLLFILYKTFKLPNIWKTVYLILIGVWFTGNGAFATYDMEALVFGALAFYFLNRGGKYILLSGIFTGFAMLTKQSYGIFFFVALLSVGLYAIRQKELKTGFFKRYIGGISLILVPFIAYLLFMDAFYHFFYYTFVFASSVKAHTSAFLLHRIVLIIMLAGVFLLRHRIRKYSLYFFMIAIAFAMYYLFGPSAHFGRLLTYLKEPLFYLYTITFGVPIFSMIIFWKEPFIVKPAIVTLAVFLGSAASGYALTPIIVSMPFFVPLLIYILKRGGKGNKLFFSTVSISYLLTITYLYPLQWLKPESPVFVSYSKKYLTETLDIKKASWISVHPKQKKEIEHVVSYLRQNTSNSESILCFPYCPLLYVLTDRKSPSFFSFFYFETFRAMDQDRLIHDIETEKPKFIVIQKRGNIEPEAEFENQRLLKVREYIFNRYRSVKETENFSIYLSI